MDTPSGTPGTLNFEAQSGGHILFDSLADPSRGISLTSSGASSEIDLPQLTALTSDTIDLSDGGTIVAPNFHAVHDSLVLVQAGADIDLATLTDLDGSQIRVSGGGHLAVSGITDHPAVPGSGAFGCEVRDAGSLLELPYLTSLAAEVEALKIWIALQQSSARDRGRSRRSPFGPRTRRRSAARRLRHATLLRVGELPQLRRNAALAGRHGYQGFILVDAQRRIVAATEDSLIGDARLTRGCAELAMPYWSGSRAAVVLPFRQPPRRCRTWMASIAPACPRCSPSRRSGRAASKS